MVQGELGGGTWISGRSRNVFVLGEREADVLHEMLDVCKMQMYLLKRGGQGEQRRYTRE